jgi:hypothetical protein
MSLGPELVVNGGFDSAAQWDLGGGATISNGKLNLNGSGGDADQDPVGTISGRTYRVSFDVSDIVGGPVPIRFALNGTGVYEETIAGAKTVQVDLVSGIAGGTVQIIEVGLTFGTAKIDNISVREVLADGGGVFAEMFNFDEDQW